MGLNSLMQGKGLLGMQMAQPPAGLLGKYYDPKQERQNKLLMGLQGAGLALLQNGKGSFGEVLGQAVAGGAQGANNAGINYKQDAMGYQQLEQQMAEQARKKKLDARDDTEYAHKLEQRNSLMDYLASLPPEEQKLAEAFPQQYAEQFLQSKFAAPAKGTDDMQEYAKALTQGYKGTLEDWIIGGKKAGADNITIGGGKYGTIPPGFELVETPTGAQLRPIPGGPAAIEAEALKTKADLAKTNKDVSADIVTQDIDRAISSLNAPGILPKTGLGADTLKGYGGTGAADLSGLLSSVEANVGFDSLAQMRAASPTGGALGSITERELALLAATKGAITQSQSKEQLKDNLNRLWNVTQDIVHGPNAGPQRRKLGFEGKNLKQKYGLE